jgi:hypothetical protein
VAIARARKPAPTFASSTSFILGIVFGTGAACAGFTGAVVFTGADIAGAAGSSAALSGLLAEDADASGSRAEEQRTAFICGVLEFAGASAFGFGCERGWRV